MRVGRETSRNAYGDSEFVADHGIQLHDVDRVRSD